MPVLYGRCWNVIWSPSVVKLAQKMRVVEGYNSAKFRGRAPKDATWSNYAYDGGPDILVWIKPPMPNSLSPMD